MIYRLTRRAQADIEQIYRYTIENFGAVQAELYLGGLDYTFDLLTDNPNMGIQFSGQVRRYTYKHHYVFYRVERRAIIILRISHTKRKLPVD